MSSRLIDFVMVEESDGGFDSFKQAFDHFKFEGRPLRLKRLSELPGILQEPGKAELPGFKPRLIIVSAPESQEDLKRFFAIREDNPHFRKIPLIVLVDPGRNPEEKRVIYEGGASSVIMKPVDPDGYFSLVESLGQYWFGVVKLPTVE